MSKTRRNRRRPWDLIVAIAIVAIIAVVAAVLWIGSDAAATRLSETDPDSVPAVPSAPIAVPTSANEQWQLAIDPQYWPVVTPYGTVAAADRHSVTGYSATSGDQLWRYQRNNAELCGIGSGDTVADPLTSWTGVHGVLTVFAKNGWCSQVTLLDPSTGARQYQRTSPNQSPGELFFGVPYVGWMSEDYLELWRHDLVATIRYGDQPNPVNPTGPHLGCSFIDTAVTGNALATIERCGDSQELSLVLNWPTPSDAPGDNGWDTNHSEPKATIPTASSTAAIIAISEYRVAIIVSDPEPAVVVYDSFGVEQSRTPVDIPGSAIADANAAGITPAVTFDGQRYSLISNYLVVMSTTPVTVTIPPDEDATNDDEANADEADADSEPESNDASSDDVSDGLPGEETTRTEDSPVLDWYAPARGLPAVIAKTAIVPVDSGWEVRHSQNGDIARTIPVERGAATGRVDLHAVGTMMVEASATALVGYRTSD